MSYSLNKIKVMGRVMKSGRKAALNRARVRKHRSLKESISIHNRYIYDKILNENNNGICGEIFDNFESINVSQNDESKIDTATEIRDKLKYWCSHHQVTASAMNDLLCLLRFAGLRFLPKDCRTLMGTPTNVPIHSLTNGKIWYNGVKTCLETALNKISSDMSITLDWNFDGLPIAKSSNMQFWPILASIRGIDLCNSSRDKIQFINMICFVEIPSISPMIIAIWCGLSKPILNEYIELLVSELESIIPNGIFISGYHIQVGFGRVQCDTPARSQMKGMMEES